MSSDYDLPSGWADDSRLFYKTTVIRPGYLFDEIVCVHFCQINEGTDQTLIQ